MARKSLTSSEKAALRKAQPSALPYVIASIRPHLRKGRWLGVTNRYEGRNLVRLRNDVRRRNVRDKNLAQYTGAAALRHCLDGWSYLGSSLYAMSRGDSDHALHLGYYASLRAAESILATQGVAILDSQHFVITTRATVARIGNQDVGTHVISWLALSHWAGLLRSADAMAQVVRPGGVALQDWLQAGFGGSKWQRVADSWLQAWGTDLKEMAGDRDQRNRASYQPGGRGLDPPPPSDTAVYLQEVWRGLEPTSFSAFDRLDRHLMRRAFDMVLLETTASPRTTRQRELAVDRLLSNMTFLPPGIDWRRFLLRKDETDDLSILRHASNLKRDVRDEHLAVAARSLLLLRVATGLASAVRRSAAVPDGELAFWWTPVAFDRGLMDPKRPTSQVQDLWSDVDTALSSIGAWLSGTPADQSYQSLNRLVGDSLHQLAGTERAAFWGLDL